MVNIGDMTIQDQAIISPSSKFGLFYRTLNAGDGDVGYTGIGFKPSYVLFFGAVTSQVGKASWGGGKVGEGVHLADQYNHIANTYTTASQVIMIVEGTSVYEYATIASLDSDGFTLTWASQGALSAANARIRYMAFK